MPKTTEELVALAVSKYAIAEKSLLKAQDALLDISKVYKQAYANAALAGGLAIKAEASMVSLAGDVATLRSEVISMHERDTEYAKAAGADAGGPYAELPPRNPDVIVPYSGGDR